MIGKSLDLKEMLVHLLISTTGQTYKLNEKANAFVCPIQLSLLIFRITHRTYRSPNAHRKTHLPYLCA